MIAVISIGTINFQSLKNKTKGCSGDSSMEGVDNTQVFPGKEGL